MAILEVIKVVDATIVVALITALSAGIGFFFSSIKDLVLYMIEKMKFKKEEDQKWKAARRLAYYEFIHLFSIVYSKGKMPDYLDAALGVLEYGDVKFINAITIEKYYIKLEFLSNMVSMMLGFRTQASHTMGLDFENETNVEKFEAIRVIASDALMSILMGILAEDDFFIKQIQSPFHEKETKARRRWPFWRRG